MDKLELKHLAPYLPYRLRIGSYSENKLSKDLILEHGSLSFLEGFLSINHILTSKKYKPILRPFSDLTKEIEVNGKKFIPIDELQKIDFFDYEWIKSVGFHIGEHNYCHVQKLIEWHFDVFRLIESGLAIDINTLNK